MSLWKIAWRSIQHRSLASGLTAFSMSLGVALIVTVIVIYGVLDQSFRRSAQGYDLIVGPKGSSLELVISTVFYQREPIGKIPYDVYTQLRSGRYRTSVEAAIPIALGEHYRGLPVVATSSEFFTKLEYLDGRKYQFSSGENFSDGDYFNAVVGYTAARKVGLKVGDKFKTMHGKDSSEEHQTEYTVVGVLRPSGTPNDGAIFINVEGFFDMHAGQDTVLDEGLRLKKAEPAKEQADDHDHAHDHAAEPKAEPPASQPAQAEPTQPEVKQAEEPVPAAQPEPAQPAETPVEENHELDHANDHDHALDHDHSTGLVNLSEKYAAEKKDSHDHAGHDHAHDHPKELSAVLVLTKEEKTTASTSSNIFGMQEEIHTEKSTTKPIMNVNIMALPQRIETDMNAQAVKPVEVITFLFEKIIGNVQLVLLILAALVVIVAGIGMMVSIYNSMNERRQEIAIMRALGARRTTVMAIILLESILLSLGGGAFGVLMGHTLIFVLGPWISGATGIIVSAWNFQLAELILIPGLIALASIVGYLPAVIAYRTDVAQSLQG